MKFQKKSPINPSTNYQWGISCRSAPTIDILAIFRRKIPTFQSMINTTLVVLRSTFCLLGSGKKIPLLGTPTLLHTLC